MDWLLTQYNLIVRTPQYSLNRLELAHSRQIGFLNTRDLKRKSSDLTTLISTRYDWLRLKWYKLVS